MKILFLTLDFLNYHLAAVTVFHRKKTAEDGSSVISTFNVNFIKQYLYIHTSHRLAGNETKNKIPRKKEDVPAAREQSSNRLSIADVFTK